VQPDSQGSGHAGCAMTRVSSKAEVKVRVADEAWIVTALLHREQPEKFEILVKPMEEEDLELCNLYEQATAATSLLIPFDLRAAKLYAALRKDRSLRPPDAIQLACAAASGTDLFVTNDNRLQSQNVPGIQFIVSLAQVPP
jgi:predicted nucleic acid-binding protein